MKVGMSECRTCGHRMKQHYYVLGDSCTFCMIGCCDCDEFDEEED